MQNIKTLSIGENKGAPRVWLEGRFPALAGFEPGSRFRLEVIRERDCVALRLDADGERRVSSKTRGERTIPVIDLNSKEALGLFEGLASVRAIADGNVIYLLPLASEARTKERLATLRAKLANNEPLTVGSLSHGGGVLSLALHEGMKAGGVETRLGWACDVNDSLLEHASEVNPAWTDKTQSLAMSFSELAFDQWSMSKLAPVQIIECGIPCQASSTAGRAKNGNGCAEENGNVGYLVAALLAIIARVNPVAVVLECVKPYQQTASAWLLRHQLAELGYSVQECIFEGAQWGTLEHRDRFCMVATTRGISFDLASVRPGLLPVQTLGDILDPVPDDSPAYREVAYLKAKQERDQAAGKGFSVPYLTPDATHVPVLRAGYAKSGSCDARLLHPTNPHLSRLLTVPEHARAKQIPLELVRDLTQTAGHQLLGQSILFPPFKALGAALARSLAELAGRVPCAIAA